MYSVVDTHTQFIVFPLTFWQWPINYPTLSLQVSNDERNCSILKSYSIPNQSSKEHLSHIHKWRRILCTKLISHQRTSLSSNRGRNLYSPLEDRSVRSLTAVLQRQLEQQQRYHVRPIILTNRQRDGPSILLRSRKFQQKGSGTNCEQPL